MLFVCSCACYILTIYTYILVIRSLSDRSLGVSCVPVLLVVGSWSVSVSIYLDESRREQASSPGRASLEPRVNPSSVLGARERLLVERKCIVCARAQASPPPPADISISRRHRLSSHSLSCVRLSSRGVVVVVCVSLQGYFKATIRLQYTIIHVQYTAAHDMITKVLVLVVLDETRGLITFIIAFFFTYSMIQYFIK